MLTRDNTINIKHYTQLVLRITINLVIKQSRVDSREYYRFKL